LIELANTAETLRRYAQRARLGMAAQNRFAFARKERSAISCGYATQFEWPSKTCPAAEPVSNPDDLDIALATLAPSTAIGGDPAKDFDWYLRTAAAQEWEITTRLLLHPSERRQPQRRTDIGIVGGRIDDLMDVFQQPGNPLQR
jgi:hypothetical protein